MYRISLIALMLLFATPCFAKDMTITLNDEEQKALLALIDAGVKASGIQGVPAAARLMSKMQEAAKQAAKPDTSPPAPNKP